MMHKRHKQLGFSLAEIMVAIGILGIGLILVAASFPVGMDQHRRMTEKTMARTIANNAKMMLADNIEVEYFNATGSETYFDPVPLHNFTMDGDGSWTSGTGDYDVNDSELFAPTNQFPLDFLDRVYPLPKATLGDTWQMRRNHRFNLAKRSRYGWCAVWRATGTGTMLANDVEKWQREVVIFVTRKAEQDAGFYPTQDINTSPDSDLAQPDPVDVDVHQSSLTYAPDPDSDSLRVSNSGGFDLLSEGGFIVDAAHGGVYKIVALRDPSLGGKNIRLDRQIVDPEGSVVKPFKATNHAYVVPPPRGIDDQPVIGVYKYTINFFN